jgi:crotonobetainyl-CoA:carnitine CoA-transferase CaiB-like acyl-CoA transferase
MPLSHLTVLEASGEIATRYCGRMFSRLGARVDRIAGGDDRTIGYAGDRGGAYGRWLDQGKRRLQPGEAAGGHYDLVIGGQDDAGVAAAVEIVEALGGRPLLLALRWFDSDGCYGDWRGSDEVINALNGIAFGFGEPSDAPMMPQGHAPQIIAGVTAFNAVLAALIAPAESRPSRVDVSVLEAALTHSEVGAMGYFVSGIRARRLGVNRFAPTFPAGSYQTLDGWLGVTALTPAQWAALCQIIGRPQLAAEPQYATAIQRLILGDELDAILIPAFRMRTTAQWVALGDEHRIPLTDVTRPADLPEAPHWVARNAFGPIGEGDVAGPELPFRFRFDGARKPAFTPAAGEGPLAGLRVIDFGMGWAGPLAGRTLADLGADVVKVESDSHQDWWRGWDPGDDAVEIRENRLNFVCANRNKRGVALDLATAEGVSRAKALVAGADVVLENYAIGVMDKLGLGQAALRSLNPGLINLSMAAFGAGGPLSGIRAYGSTVEQASGLPWMNGEAEWAPCLQHVAYGDPVGGLFGAAAILAALAGRARLGGADIDMAQVQCLFQLGADGLVAARIDPDLPRTGRARARLALSLMAPAGGEEDSWLYAAAADATDRARLAQALGVRADSPDQALADAFARFAAARSDLDGATALQAAGVLCAPVQPVSSLCFDLHLTETGFWPLMDRAYVGEHLTAHAPFRLDGERIALRRNAPLLGEHTEEVLAELAETTG